MARKLSDSAAKLIKDYGLVDDPTNPNSDVFHSNNFSIIVRAGIDKISAKANVSSTLEVVYSSPSEVVIKGEYSSPSGERKVTTFGESSVDEYQLVEIIKSGIPTGGLNALREALTTSKVDENGEVTNNKVIDNGLVAALSAMTPSVEKSYERVIMRKGNVTSATRDGTPIANYRWALAEKRANSRGVLKLVGLYDEGFFGEDESDSFSDVVKSERSNAKSTSKPKTVVKEVITMSE